MLFQTIWNRIYHNKDDWYLIYRVTVSFDKIIFTEIKKEKTLLEKLKRIF
jgi:mRNA-degrading endonuclease YafQ of YafQ-DinJ toxin-antitoxin module